MPTDNPNLTTRMNSLIGGPTYKVNYPHAIIGALGGIGKDLYGKGEFGKMITRVVPNLIKSGVANAPVAKQIGVQARKRLMPELPQ